MLCSCVRLLQKIRTFDFAGVGILVALFGILYMAFFAGWMLPKAPRKSEDDAVPTEQHRHYLAAFGMQKGSPLVGRAINASGLTTARDVDFVGLIVGGKSMPFDTQHVLQDGDR
jgi:hypothetical protein